MPLMLADISCLSLVQAFQLFYVPWFGGGDMRSGLLLHSCFVCPWLLHFH